MNLYLDWNTTAGRCFGPVVRLQTKYLSQYHNNTLPSSETELRVDKSFCYVNGISLKRGVFNGNNSAN